MSKCEKCGSGNIDPIRTEEPYIVWFNGHCFALQLCHDCGFMNLEEL